MFRNPNRLRLSFTLMWLLFSMTLLAQIRIASPYSRFGLGDISDNNNAWNLSMGQTSYAFRSPYHINYSNPASYTAFDSLSFVFEGGFNSEFVKLTSNFQSTSRNYASLGYLLFGMPITKWWRTSLGLVPFSDVGYSVLNYETYNDIGTVLRLYSGSGGINRFFWGNGFRLNKNFSIGFNFSYLFGSMERQAVVFFPDSINSMNFKVDYYIMMSDIHFNYGIQYRAKLKNDLYMTLGGVFSATTNMNAKTDLIAQTFLLGANETEYIKDTLALSLGVKGKIVIPWMFGGGIALEKPEKWMVGMDYRWQNWKKFTVYDASDSLVNSWQVSVGAEITPNALNYSNYLSRIRYRLGFIYNNTYLQLRSKNLTEYALSLGFGLPLRGVKTMLNVGVQAGMRGTTEFNLIKESYIKLVVGFTIYERWFVKRKYY